MDLNLLLVGGSGHGKSSTGNSILGEKFFTQRSSSSVVDEEIVIAKKEMNCGRKVTLVEVPLLPQANLDPEKVEKMFKGIKDVFDKSPNGFHGMLIVLKYGIRFTKQEKDVIMMIKSVFGSRAVEKYGIIVLTYGDNFILDTEDEGLSFDTWCQNQIGDVQALFKECGDKLVLFNNRLKNEETMQVQREKLFSIIESMQNEPKVYTLKDYEKAEDEHLKLLVTSELCKLVKETRSFLNDKEKQIDQLSRADSSKIESLKNLLEELHQHKKHLQDKDQGTGIFNNLLIEMAPTELRIETKIKLAECRLALGLPDHLKNDELWELMDENLSSSTVFISKVEGDNRPIDQEICSSSTNQSVT